MKKKVSAILCALLLCLTMTACAGSAAPKLPSLAVPEEGAARQKTSGSFADSLEGLCSYMEENQAVAGDKTEMAYKEIGAVGGFRYRFTYNGSTVQAEFYEFAGNSSDEKAAACLADVREKGSFELLGNRVPAVLSGNGRYLMVYTDGNAEKKDENRAQKQWVEELLQSF